MGKRKRAPAYLKIIQGMNACYGMEDRDCVNCPYDKYNDRDFYGMGTALCMEKLNEAARKWTESMSMFTNCRDCCMYRDGWQSESEFDFNKVGKDGWCGYWNTVMCPEEFCSRGATRD